jgi:hypothetical protein
MPLGIPVRRLKECLHALSQTVYRPFGRRIDNAVTAEGVKSARKTGRQQCSEPY